MCSMYVRDYKNLEWNLDNVLKLIELYRQHPCLWDSALDDYKCRRMRNEAWNEISRSLNIERIEIERKMKNLMSQFSRECKRYVKAKMEGRQYRTRWFGFKKLFFLKSKNKQDMLKKIKKENLQIHLPHSPTSNDDDSNVNENYDNSDSPLPSTSTEIHNNFESCTSSLCHLDDSTENDSNNINDPFEDCELSSDDVHQIPKTSSDSNNMSSTTLEAAVVVTDVEMSSQTHQHQQHRKPENLNDSNERKIALQKILLHKKLKKLKSLQNAKMTSNQTKIENSQRSPINDTKNLKKIKTKEIYDLAYKTLTSSSSNNADNNCQINGSQNFVEGDRFDNIGRNFALKLKQMDRKQQIIAEKIISDVIFYGEIEQLTVGTAHKISNVLANPRKD